MTLQERLREWAQNNEMIDSHYTQHGKDCLKAAERLDEQDYEDEYDVPSGRRGEPQ